MAEFSFYESLAGWALDLGSSSGGARCAGTRG